MLFDIITTENIKDVQYDLCMFIYLLRLRMLCSYIKGKLIRTITRLIILYEYTTSFGCF